MNGKKCNNMNGINACINHALALSAFQIKKEYE
jgi:hypothetical protein